MPTSGTDLKASFERAVAESKTLPERPDNQTLLKLYALYKQATEGDSAGDRPGITDFIGRAKWDAWHSLAGLSADEAMRRYVAQIEQLKG
jgi:acyl-CoA-binding protein